MSLSMIRPRLLWPAVILLSAVLTALFFVLDIASPLRLVTTFWFLLVCPGMAFVRLQRFDESHYEWTLAIALSIAVDGIVACLLLYLHLWSVELGLSILIVLSLLGAYLQLRGTRLQVVDTELEQARSLPGTEIEERVCPRCYARQKQHKAGRTRSGKQRYRCGYCKRGYTTTRSGYLPEVQTPASGIGL